MKHYIYTIKENRESLLLLLLDHLDNVDIGVEESVETVAQA